jgi:hypothetical protein
MWAIEDASERRLVELDFPTEEAAEVRLSELIAEDPAAAGVLRVVRTEADQGSDTAPT